jgi:hypothetical protein
VYSSAHGVYVGSRGYYGYHGGYYGGYYAHVAPVHFYRPYYTFHPWYSVGFGLYIGYPFAYTSAFYNPYYYPYPYGYVAPYAYPPYPYAYPPYPAGAAAPAPAAPYPPASAQQQSPGASVDVQQGQANTGGLSFEITPATAQIFVDGALVGTVGQFTPTSQPLGLSAGRHHLEIRADGYHSMTFDADIVAGQVIPYQGTMER